jgi:uncharacterized protein YgiM (DUF1202 family)
MIGQSAWKMSILTGALFLGVIAAPRVNAQLYGPKGTRADVCNFAKVYHLNAAIYLVVRAGPGKEFTKIDRLKAGTTVYVCDEHREWLRVFYGGAGTACNSESTSGLDFHEVGSCKSGWVNRKWIDVLSG